VESGEAPLEILKHERVFSIVVNTVLGLIIFKTLLYCFACPNNIVNLAASTPGQVRRARRCNCIGTCLGYILVAVGIGYLFVDPIFKAGLESDPAQQDVSQPPGYRPVHTTTVGPFELASTAMSSGELYKDDGFTDVLAGRGYAYIIGWITMVLLTFNPFVAWGKANPGETSKLAALGDLTGIGKWRLQKQLFQARCVEALARLEDSWFTWKSGSGNDGNHFDVGQVFTNPWSGYALLG